MASPIVIGSYCADFDITQPLSGPDYYYYKFDYCGASYYLASSKVITGSEPTLGATGGSTSSIRVIESPYVVPNQVQATAITNSMATASDNFREFRFRPVWDPSFTPDFTTSTTVVPLDQRRYLTWKSGAASNDVTDRYSSAAMVERFVRINSKTGSYGSINDNLTIKFDGVSATTGTSGSQAAIASGSNFTPSTASSSTPCSPSVRPSIANMVFTATTVSPTIQERAPRLVYLILKEDFDRLRTTAVTAGKQLRYLIKEASTQRFALRDLYDPNVTVSTIKKCAYRVSKQTNVDISPAPLSPPVTTWNQVTTWGVDAFFHTSDITITGILASSDPSGTRVKYPDAFGTDVTSTTGRTNGFVAGDFSKYSDGTGYTNESLTTENLLASGFNNVVITIPSVTYDDYTKGFDTPDNITTTNMQFVMTDFIIDKTVEELFTDMNVTLLRLAQIRYASPSSPALTPPAGTGTEHYLGFENITPSSTVSVETASPPTNPTVNYLITRDYFKFRESARATQFKFYDLGRGTEYLWQVRWPQGTTQETYGYVTFDSSAASGAGIRFSRSSDINQDTRGWILEYVTGMTPPGVLLKWAGPVFTSTPNNQYIIMDTSTSYDGSTDGKPRKISTTLGPRNDAAVFNCIQCSEIDVSGACKPITVNPRTGGFTQQPTARITITGISPLPVSGSFKLRIVSSPPGTQYLYYTLTQIASSPSGSPAALVASPQPPSAFIVSSTSPTPTAAVFDFEFSRNGVLSARSRSRNAVFIKDSSGERYLKFNTAGGLNRVELQPSNRPSDEDGFAWIIETTSNPNQFKLFSVAPSNISPTPTARYLSSNGMSLVAKGSGDATFVFEGLTMPSSPSSMTVSNAAA